eukprot:TRINITY_DN7728_c0_g1_i2.p1 TRINITY_DN7728_c0_g1~~TRINITY_DN7728_c0_g1_i2.p1  ORF type:complete len:409 (+),score=75.34 TRINITY_DN7728_c0_g1_i2:1-1227(+)
MRWNTLIFVACCWYFATSMPAVHIDINIDVVLLGLQSDRYNVDTLVVRNTLERLFEYHEPINRENNQSIGVIYDLTYTVTHNSAVSKYEKILKDQLSERGAYVGSFEFHDPVIPVPFEDFQSLLDSIVRDNAFTVVFVNADQSITDSGYYYSVCKNYFGTNVWISPKKYIVVDISAYHPKLGSLSHTHGSTTDLTTPNILGYDADHNSISKVHLPSHIASTVIKSIKHVFLPDIQFSELKEFKKILIPIITFKDHNDEIDAVDIDMLKSEVRKLLPYTEEEDISVIEVSHSLHEHKLISLSILNSIRHVSFNEIDIYGEYKLRKRDVLDTERLIYNLREVKDPFGSGLLGDMYSEETKAFSKLRFESDKVNAIEWDSSSKGINVLPVYFLSLREMYDIILETDSQVKA